MSSSESCISNATIAPVAFKALQRTLQQATQFIREQEPEAEVYIVQETSLGTEHIRQLKVRQFTLVMSQRFSALLLVHGRTENDGFYQIELILKSEAIAHFLRQLMLLIAEKNTLQTSLKYGLALIQDNHPVSQSQFTLAVMAELAQHYNQHYNEALNNPSQSSYSSAIAPHLHNPVKSTVDHSNGHPPHISLASTSEQLLQHAVRQTQSADRVKSEFLAAMSHELRTPLTYILGMSATLLRWSGTGSEDALPERQRHYLQNIHNQGEHLLELIDDLLDLSQLESGHLGLELQEFSLTLLIQQSLNVYRKKAKRKGVTLEIDSHITPEGDRITADPHRLQQIVANLLSNAIKFTPQSGTVTVRLSTDSHLVEIQVRDTGIGIPDHHQTLIFQTFKQLDSSYHRQYEGTGLGLALTKQLVDLHCGWIECASTVGVGTVFTVKLPRHPLSEPASMPTAHQPASSSQSLGRIVLVDDDDESGHFVSDMLTAAGYQLVWILEGLTAISQLEMLQPTVIIISEHLINNTVGAPNIIKVLRQSPITKRIKIIVLSSSSSLPRASNESLGADLILTHPLTPEELLHRVGAFMTTYSNQISVQ